MYGREKINVNHKYVKQGVKRVNGKVPSSIQTESWTFLTHRVLHSEIFGPDDDALRSVLVSLSEKLS